MVFGGGSFIIAMFILRIKNKNWGKKWGKCKYPAVEI